MAIGIIAEFNPLHYGHTYLIDKAKEIYPNEEIIVVLGGNILQRGNLSIIEKYDKTKIALDSNVDLVVELPYPFATQSADIFAKGSIEILNKLKVDKLIFGSEEGIIDKFIKVANTQINNKEYDKLVKSYLDKGNNYPTSMNKALKELIDVEIDKPNDLLALSYIKEILKNNYKIEPITIKRTNNYHSKELEEISSASSIREAFKNNIDISSYIPKEEIKYLKIDYEDKLFNLLKYKILSENDLSIYNLVDEGIDNKIKEEINKSNNLDDLINNIKSKRYTYNRIERILSFILFNYKKENNNTNLNYIRVLGFNSTGQNYLNKIKKDITIPIITTVTIDNYNIIKEDLNKDIIYYEITNRDIDVLKSKPIIKK